MTESAFVFGSHSSREFHLRIEKIPVIKMPARKMSRISVPGRNGDLHIDEGAFENYIQPYECYFHGPQAAPELAHAIKTWLATSGVYQRLEDTYDPDHYRLATYTGPMDIANILHKYGRCTINFDCAPQSFLKTGEQPLSFAAPGVLYNPTGFPSRPLVVVHGSGQGSVTIGDCTVTVKQIQDHIILDCDLQHAYRQTAEAELENMNGCISAPTFPVLGPGESRITWTGDITHLEITPRWWTL
jgi:phage-related protein